MGGSLARSLWREYGDGKWMVVLGMGVLCIWGRWGANLYAVLYTSCASWCELRTGWSAVRMFPARWESSINLQQTLRSRHSTTRRLTDPKAVDDLKCP